MVLEIILISCINFREIKRRSNIYYKIGSHIWGGLLNKKKLARPTVSTKIKQWETAKDQPGIPWTQKESSLFNRVPQWLTW